MKSFPRYLEAMIPNSGEDADCPAAYKNAIMGRDPTVFADYAQYLRRQHPENASFRMLADLIEIHHGEQRSHVFHDFFPARSRVLRIDDRTTGPDRGWRLDQDRRCRDQLARYDEWGYVR